MAKEAKDEVIVLTGDGLEDIEYKLLVKQFGKEVADELVGNSTDDAEEFDEEIQDIIDSAPALDEI